jgi:hypothetical protein
VLLVEPHRSDRCATPVRPVQIWTDSGLVRAHEDAQFGSGGRGFGGWYGKSAGG